LCIIERHLHPIISTDWWRNKCRAGHDGSCAKNTFKHNKPLFL